MSEKYSDQYELPRVTKDTLQALEHDLKTDATYISRVFSFHNNRNHSLMRHIVIAANEQAQGHMDRQTSFVSGARYVLAALQRQLDTHELALMMQVENISEEPAPDVLSAQDP